jgi:prepilin-type N-terminal cleavage/methylation domain-containing protein
VTKSVRGSRFEVERRTPNAEPWAERGFTLIELVLTIALVAVALALVLPRIGITPSLTASSRHLVGAIHALFTAAAASNRTYRLNIDLDQHAYWATVLTTDGDRLPSDPLLASRTTLPSRVRFEDVTTGLQGKVTAGKVLIEFFPGGLMDRAVIHLSNHTDQILTMVLNPLTGGVQVNDRYMEPPEPSVPEAYRQFFKALPPRLTLPKEKAVRP